MARLADAGGTSLALSPADFRKLIADETEKWAKVVKFAGIKQKKTEPHLLFELGNRLRERRLRDAKPNGRPTDAARLCYSDEIAQFSKIHIIVVYQKNGSISRRGAQIGFHSEGLGRPQILSRC